MHPRQAGQSIVKQGAMPTVQLKAAIHRAGPIVVPVTGRFPSVEPPSWAALYSFGSECGAPAALFPLRRCGRRVAPWGPHGEAVTESDLRMYLTPAYRNCRAPELSSMTWIPPPSPLTVRPCRCQFISPTREFDLAIRSSTFLETFFWIAFSSAARWCCAMAQRPFSQTAKSMPVPGTWTCTCTTTMNGRSFWPIWLQLYQTHSLRLPRRWEDARNILSPLFFAAWIRAGLDGSWDSRPVRAARALQVLSGLHSIDLKCFC